MSKIAQLLFLVVLTATVSSQLSEKKWYENAILYQIYPRSFYDSNGDGVGDIKGVTQKIAYLKEIGVTGSWLSPIMKSPMADYGYDISDFFDVDPLFGNMADCEEMFAAAKKVGVKLIMDLVPNHSSDECEWFVKSAARDPEYEDFYVWHPGKIVNGVREPPTNWISVFRGSMWTWNEQRQEYYLHQFLAKQPDLNYRNPKVVAKMKEVLRFWIEKGASGYRVDAVPHIFEIAPDADGNYPDEPVAPWGNDPNAYEYHDHIYTRGQPETFDLMYEFRAYLEELQTEFKKEEYILMLEGNDDLPLVAKYFGNGTALGAQLPMNFRLLNDLNSNSNAIDFKASIDSWLNIVPEGRVSNWLVGNHDSNRVGSRLGYERIDVINMLTASLPGCMITYNGEEFGMTDIELTWEETQDPQACQSSPELYKSKSRDPERSPMQWAKTTNAGFTNANTRPWLPINNNFNLVNVQVQRGIPRSHLNVYKQLSRVRKAPALTHGDLDVQALNENVLVIKRSYAGYPSHFSVLNVNNKIERVNLKSLYEDLPENLQYAVVTDRCTKRVGDMVSSHSVLLMPNEGVVLRENFYV